MPKFEDEVKIEFDSETGMPVLPRWVLWRVVENPYVYRKAELQIIKKRWRLVDWMRGHEVVYHLAIESKSKHPTPEEVREAAVSAMSNWIKDARAREVYGTYPSNRVSAAEDEEKD